MWPGVPYFCILVCRSLSCGMLDSSRRAKCCMRGVWAFAGPEIYAAVCMCGGCHDYWYTGNGCVLLENMGFLSGALAVSCALAVYVRPFCC